MILSTIKSDISLILFCSLKHFLRSCLRALASAASSFSFYSALAFSSLLLNSAKIACLWVIDLRLSVSLTISVTSYCCLSIPSQSKTICLCSCGMKLVWIEYSRLFRRHPRSTSCVKQSSLKVLRNCLEKTLAICRFSSEAWMIYLVLTCRALLFVSSIFLVRASSSLWVCMSMASFLCLNPFLWSPSMKFSWFSITSILACSSALPQRTCRTGSTSKSKSKRPS